MIDFVILPDDPDQYALEFVRAYISYDCRSARYSPEVRTYSPAKIEAFRQKPLRMKNPETGEAFNIVPIFISEKIKEHEDPASVMKKHVSAYLFGHPLRYVIEKQIDRLNA